MKPAMRVLLVEDEPTLADSLRRGLREERYVVDAVFDGETALDYAVAEYQRVLDILDVQVDRLTRLTADLLLLARGNSQHEPCVRERIDLSGLLDAVAEYAQILARNKGIGFETAIAPGLRVLGDHDQLTRLCMNLLDNAIRYTSSSGLIQLRAHHVESDTASEGQCAVEIRDTGEGILPEHLPHIFERFYRADTARSRAAGGSGLGLAIARQIAEAHGGIIAVRSTVGQGTTFTVTLTTTTAGNTDSYPKDLVTISPQ